ncbi:MAG: gliding motility-associated C-terminal domain-containing protein [Flavobacteriales bacterium]
MDRYYIRHKLLAAGVLCLLAVPRAWAQCSIFIGSDTTVCQGTQAQLHGPAGYSNYLWNTGQVSQNISTGVAGDYWCRITYPSGNLVTNGDFNSGNTGFSSQFTYSATSVQNEGYYTVGANAHNYHTQFQGTGTGNFLIVNAGYLSWLNNQYDAWCQTIPVCPGQTYTLSYRARTLTNDLPARITWRMDGYDQWPEVTLPSYSAGWQTITSTWTAGAGQTSVSACLHVTSGDGVGDDFGIDDISISGTIALTDTVHVNVIPLPTVNLGADTTLCQGEILGLNATVPGGSYVWNNGSTSATRTISTAGIYGVTVTAQGCSNADQINVAFNPVPVLDLGADTTLCVGNNITLSAALPGATYSWSNGSSASTLNVNTSGTYWGEVDLNGCTDRDTILVSFNALPVVNLGPDTTLCQGETLALNATVPGGSYVWNNGSTSGTRTISTAGIYAVTVTALGCSNADQINVAFNTVPVVDLGADTTLCAGNSITLSAALPGATYSWSNGSSASTLNINTSGTYWAEVDLNGCTDRDTVLVSFNALPVVNLGSDTTLCQGETLGLNATVPGGSYVWNNGATSATRNISTAGIYAVTVTVQGCSNADQINVAFNPLPVVDLGADVLVCPGASATFNATVPAATYLWNSGSTASSITTGTPGTYSVQVTVDGCSASDAIVLGNFNLQTVNLGPDLSLCAGQPQQVGLNIPGATYLWSTGATVDSIMIASAGTVWVRATLNGCIASDTMSVTVTPLPAVSLGSDQPICPGATLALDATVAGTATYLWNNGATSPTITAGVGTWQVAVTQAGCTGTDMLSITALPLPLVDLGPDTTLCAGNSINLSAATPGATYAWNDGSSNPTFSVGSPGSYWVEADLNGCMDRDTVTIGFSPLPIVAIGPDTVLCQGGILALNAAVPGGSYLWNDGVTTASRSLTNTGTYSVIVTVNGCSNSDQVEVTFDPVPAVDLGPDTAICAYGQVMLNAASPGAIFLWNDGSTLEQRTVGAGTWSVVASADGCTASDQVIITSLPTPQAQLPLDTILCGAATWQPDLTQTGADYLWSTGATTPSLLIDQPGTYTVSVNIGNCSATAQTVVSIVNMATLTLGPDTILCPGHSVTVGSNAPGVSVIWQDGYVGNIRTIAQPGNFQAQFLLANCMAEDALAVQFTPLPALALGPDQVICAGDTLWLDPEIGVAQLHWGTGTATVPLPVTTTGPVIGQLTLEGCVSHDTLMVEVRPFIRNVDLGSDRSICADNTITLDAGIAGAYYTWSDGSHLSTLLVDRPGEYRVQVEGPCIFAVDTVWIDQGRCATLVFVPNAFSPDGDGINEVFLPSLSDPVDQWSFDVFDRWGERIFHSSSPDAGWDGTKSGKQAPVGVYVWMLHYEALTDMGVEQVLHRGSVTLLR